MLNWTDEQVAYFSELNEDEFECNVPAYEVLQEVQSGAAVIERREYGFAVIFPSSTKALRPHLWLLFLQPECRGNGLGRKFMRELMSKYSTDYHMTLKCYGPERRKFFGRLGFRVESHNRTTGARFMSTNRMD
jgi:GNAT superfamily N-acetyltransferase